MLTRSALESATAKASFKEQKAKYISAIEGVNGAVLDDQFRNTPDLEKPLFVARLNLRSIDAARSAVSKAQGEVEELRARVKKLEAQKERKWKIKTKARTPKEGPKRKRTYPAKTKKKPKRK